MFKECQRVRNSGVQGYEIPLVYHHNNPSKTRPSSAHPKKSTYLDDAIRIHGNVPGPGTYQSLPPNRPQSKRKSRSFCRRKTYLDQIMERSKKASTPAPGTYNCIESQKKHKHSKTVETSRATYLDSVQFLATTTPGVGTYLTSPPLKLNLNKASRKSLVSRRPIHSVPDVGTYSPLLLTKKDFSKRKTQWSSQQRFINDKHALVIGPTTYTVSLMPSSKPQKSVYYH